jgi:hypothetical protein
MKEVLRYHPIGHHAVKQSVQDDILPLQHPIRTFSGQQLSEVRIPKGIRITISIAAYNRLCPFLPSRLFENLSPKTQRTVQEQRDLW